MIKSDEIQELSKALVAANKEVNNPKKNANNPHFKNDYATLDSVIESFKEAYLKHSISVLENPVSQDGLIGVSITLLHDSGQYITHDPFLLPPGKNTAQGYGSSITYARRYALSAVMNIAADDDDDGNQASAEPKQSQKQPSKPVIQAKFKQAGGTDAQFDDWFNKQIAAGVTNQQMDDLMTKKLVDKK